MMQVAAAREATLQLTLRVAGLPSWQTLRELYLELAPLIGQLQGAVQDAARSDPENPNTCAAQHELDTLKAKSRKIGHDMRLASPAALQMALESVLESVERTLDAVEGLDSTPGDG